MRALVAGTILFLVATAAPAGAAPELARSVMAGGGTTGAGGGLVLRGTLGQAVAGGSAGPGFRVCAGYWCATEFSLVDVGPAPDPRDPAAGLEFALGAAVPNPTRGNVRLALTLPAAARVTLETFDVAGRRVGEPLAHAFDAGRYVLAWDAARVGPGVYFARLRVDGTVRAERRIVVVR
jgi:hypothetical protein